MKPILKISQITTLHDARYCSAVGIQLLSFQLEPGLDTSVSPKVAAEMISWLSGPVYIGEFGYQTPAEINAILKTVPLSYAEVPLDYHPDLGAEIQSQLIFRPQDPRMEMEDVWSDIETLADRFPTALFELQLSSLNPELPGFSGLLDRLIVDYADPDAIYAVLKKKGLKPYGFHLGAFVRESDGELDYEKCDEFLEAYEAVLI